MQPFNLTGIFLPALISTFFHSKVKPIEESTLLTDYDYIVIGSGYAGALIANRLSENLNHTVLLLEAGAKDNVTTQIPILPFILMRAGYDWMYESVPQKKACFGMNNQTCNLISGKVIGGSSTIDLMMYKRSLKEDFDEWAKLGIPGWSYKDVLPFFKKSEDYRTDGTCVGNTDHGCGGELFIGPQPEETEQSETKYFMQATKEMGFDEIGYDGPKTIGAAKGQYTLKNGVRQSAATAFLRPVMTRPNLHISLDSFVHKILIDPETKRAVGVEFKKHGKIIQIKAKKEIILSAGVYSSPKILMLSGIGPKETLEKFNISVIADLPGVGQHLKEKIGSFLILTKGSALTAERTSVLSIATANKWKKGTGLLASPCGLDAILYLKSKYADKNSVRPDTEIVFQALPLHFLTETFIKRARGYNDKFWNTHLAPFLDEDSVTLYPTVLLPNSTGSVTIRSSDPYDHPLIDPNYYDDEIDRKILIEALKTAEQFASTPVFKQHNYFIRRTLEKECEQYEDPQSDEYIACFIKYGSITKWSGCCTNKMGPDTDSMAVVDHRLRVRGVNGLRIADASVMPDQHTGTNGGATVMIGEKAAHMIKEDNQ